MLDECNKQLGIKPFLNPLDKRLQWSRLATITSSSTVPFSSRPSSLHRRRFPQSLVDAVEFADTPLLLLSFLVIFVLLVLLKRYARRAGSLHLHS